jgi:hypothetical protein
MHIGRVHIDRETGGRARQREAERGSERERGAGGGESEREKGAGGAWKVFKEGV